MSSIETIIASKPPRTLMEAREKWPERDPRKLKIPGGVIERTYYPSPEDWRDEVLYFLLPDRFSNGQESAERLLTEDLSSTQGIEKIRQIRGSSWNWQNWQTSGAEYFQGGTLPGILSKLDYLSHLGVTTLWIGPIFKQRVEENTYHGYAIHDFLDIDPRFGTRKDLIELVDAAHARGMRIILDIIFNHSGCNWIYDLPAGNGMAPPYLQTSQYGHIWPRNGYGMALTDPYQTLGDDDYVWPSELQGDEHYLRAGKGDLGRGDFNDPNAEHKRTDFETLRKFNLFSDETLNDLVLIYQYWIALTDIDGYRIDTFKHVSFEQARNFCNALKEYAEDLGKNNFFLVTEVAGGNQVEDRYLDITGRNLNACLDIGEQREMICKVGKGLEAPRDFFGTFDHYDSGMGSHRTWGSRHVSIANDHDHVFGSKIRLAANASNDHQGSVVTAIQLFSLGIPCIYYGTEQGLASGAEAEEQHWLNWGGHDCLLRETMFGPEHPRAKGWEGAHDPVKIDYDAIGFGPHGTAGWHVFNEKHPNFIRMSQMTETRKKYKALRHGRQYERQISFCDKPFDYYGPGEIITWSRLFDEQEMLVVVNPHGVERRGAHIVIDATLSKSGMQIVLNTDPSAPQELKTGAFLKPQTRDGRLVLENISLGPSEIMVLANVAALEEAKTSL